VEFKDIFSSPDFAGICDDDISLGKIRQRRQEATKIFRTRAGVRTSAIAQAAGGLIVMHGKRQLGVRRGIREVEGVGGAACRALYLDSNMKPIVSWKSKCRVQAEKEGNMVQR
jgi:hypothetical protein